MGMLNCDINIPEVKGLESQKMTVGRHLIFNCKSDTSLDSVDVSQLTIKSATHDPITYKVFAIQKPTADQVQIEMTFYKAQEIQTTEFVLFDGTTEHQINASLVKIESVLQPSQDGKPPQPFNSIFPITLSVPMSYYIIILSVVVFTCLYSFFKIKRLNYYRKLKEKLAVHDSPTDPDVQFYRSVRLSEKQSYPLKSLEEAFRLFCLRTYEIPLFDLSDEKAVSYFKHNSPALKAERLQLQKALQEFITLKAQEQNLEFEDKNEFVKKLYRFVEQSKRGKT
jgi:hypothetical protein